MVAVRVIYLLPRDTSSLRLYTQLLYQILVVFCDKQVSSHCRTSRAASLSSCNWEKYAENVLACQCLRTDVCTCDLSGVCGGFNVQKG